jgi:hypothetical protein
LPGIQGVREFDKANHPAGARNTFLVSTLQMTSLAFGVTIALSLAADAAMWRSTSSSIPKPHKSSCSGSRIRRAKAIALQGDVSDTQKRGGVLGTTSVHEESAWSSCSAYTASKAAVSPE